jgi:hypothetical protein
MPRRLVGLVFVLVLVVSLLILPRGTSAHELCIPSGKTPHCFSDPLSDSWENNGGRPVFGSPITTAATEANADTGKMFDIR